jgi:hypothetical protein
MTKGSEMHARATLQREPQTARASANSPNDSGPNMRATKITLRKLDPE